MKLWIILFTLRELLKFVQLKITGSVKSIDSEAVTNEESLVVTSNAINLFAKNLLHLEEPIKF